MPNLTKEELEAWGWDYPLQLWRHRPCEADPKVLDSHSGAQRCCLACGARDPECFTWEDVMAFVKRERLDQEEYFQHVDDYSWSASPKDGRADQVWTPDVWHVAVYWVIGGSEGYYVHVDAVTRSDKGPAAIKARLLGKFWSQAEAERATRLIQDYVNKAQQGVW